MNSELDLLQPYPFEKLRDLLAGIKPAELSAISLSIGEPKHPAPDAVLETMAKTLRGVETYPSTRGIAELREAIAAWLCQRFALSAADALAEHHILPVNGTREGLFAIAQCLLDRQDKRRSVLMPNPFYQIYEGAVLLAGAKPEFYAIDHDADANLDAIDEALWQRCQMVYICTPGNPTGSVLSRKALQKLIERSEKHDFVIVSDECYSEIYREAAGPPCGLLQAAASLGLSDYRRCLVFHSLSKRSNLPGLRSGFVAGDASLIKRFLTYRTYHGCSMSEPVQRASVVAWQDEQHVKDNRLAYDEKYAAVTEILGRKLQIITPAAGFYLWPEIPVNDQTFTHQLLADYNVRVVPGSYLAREVAGQPNPGKNHIRLALVATLNDCVDAANRIAMCLSDSRSDK